MLPRSLTARLMMAAMIGLLAATVAGVAVISALLWPISPTAMLRAELAFNAALMRLETGFRVQQEFLASAAHELKTPLALLQAEIELGFAADTSYLLRDTALMARIVHQLLHLAEVTEGHNYTFASIDLQTEVREAIEYLERLADQRSVQYIRKQRSARASQRPTGARFSC